MDNLVIEDLLFNLYDRLQRYNLINGGRNDLSKVAGAFSDALADIEIQISAKDVRELLVKRI